jgi:hypothetical protein
MEPCVYCGTDTQLHSAETPICLECLDRLEAGQLSPTLPENQAGREKAERTLNPARST